MLVHCLAQRFLIEQCRNEGEMDLKGRNFLTLKDFTPEEITYLLDLSATLKEKKKEGE